MIKKILLLAIIAAWVAGCATTKNAAKFHLGIWEYVVKNTPEGDFTGTMVISKDGDAYSAVMKSPDQETPLHNVVIDGDNFSGSFDYMGYNVIMKGVFAGDSLTGEMSVEYNSFPFTATKVKK